MYKLALFLIAGALSLSASNGWVSNGRIFRGNDANANQFPFQVKLFVQRVNKLDICSGTLISEWFVLTSAHCVRDAVYVNAYLGAQTSQFTFDGVLIDKSRITLHEKYDSKTQENDIALIELPTAAKLCHNVQPAYMPKSARENFDTKLVTIAGWGREGNLGQVAAKLKFTTMTVITNKECEKKLGLKILKPSQMCAQSGPNKNSPCLGDSGGPLMLKDSNTVVGIVGPIAANCELGLPIVVTKLAVFLDWIDQRTNKGRWQPFDFKGAIMPNALYAGHDVDGDAIYVGRAVIGGDVIPGKVIPKKQRFFYSYNGREFELTKCEVLCGGSFSWKKSRDGEILPKALIGGRTGTGEVLYIGRVLHAGSLIPGKVQPQHKQLYIPFKGFEVAARNYEMLVEN